MENEPLAPAQMHGRQVVAEAILCAAENPTRDMLVGEAAALNSLVGRLAPSLDDKIMKVAAFKGQHDDRAAKPGYHQALERA